MSRDLIDPEVVERNRQMPGGWTFNADVPKDYDGVLFIVAALKLGDHAHLDVHSGRQHANPDGREPTRHFARAGRLCLRWYEWETLRDLLNVDGVPIVLREVCKPTRAQLDHHVSGKTDGKREGEWI